MGSLVKAQPVIDHLAVDEAQDKLLIYGSFGSLQGTVTIDDIALEVLDWSDSLVYAELPSQGIGAAGSVVVKEQAEISFPRILSLFKLKILVERYYCWYGKQGIINRQPLEALIWNVNWRADIGKRNPGADSLITFEISRTSSGFRGSVAIPWSDTLQKVDSSISVRGMIDLKKMIIVFDSARLNTPYCGYDPRTIVYKPLPIYFDESGYISGYIDSGHQDFAPPTQWDNRIYDQQILFPPSPKSVVTFEKVDHTSPIHIFSDHFEFTNPRSQHVSIKIYDYMGREVQPIFYGHLSEGSHAFSIVAHPAPHSTYFLVVKSDEGCWIKKVE
jgi:hypothetical protein